MPFEGDWRDYNDHKTGELRGSTIRVSAVWKGEVFLSKPDPTDGRRYWETRLNDRPCGGFPSIETAKSRIDWQIWNEMRLAQEGYEKVAARQETNVSFV